MFPALSQKSEHGKHDANDLEKQIDRLRSDEEKLRNKSRIFEKEELVQKQNIKDNFVRPDGITAHFQ